MKKFLAFISIILIIFTIYTAYAFGYQSGTAYYSIVIVQVPSWISLNLSDTGRLYALTSYSGYRALIKVDYDTGTISFPTTYESNNYIPQKMKNFIKDIFTEVIKTKPERNANLEIYYLNEAQGNELYVCSNVGISRGPDYEIAYGNVPLRGIIMNDIGRGYKIVVFFDILQATGEVCGKPIHKQTLGIFTTVASLAIIARAIKSFLQYR